MQVGWLGRTIRSSTNLPEPENGMKQVVDQLIASTVPAVPTAISVD